MAGVKGRSGGARPNTGGKRPGAGRKPTLPAVVDPKTVAPGPEMPPEDAKDDPESIAAEADMLLLLKKIALGHIAASPAQVRAAVAAVQYTHTKRGDGGIKEGRQDAAKKAATGRFAPSEAPPLRVVGGSG